MQYIIDTNVFISNPDVLSNLEGKIFIPLSVIRELDNLKLKEGDLGERARHSIRNIDAILKDECSNVEVKEDDTSIEYVDDRIIALARSFSLPPKILSNDLCLRIKAKSFGIESESYYGTLSDRYQGHTEVYVPNDIISSIYKDKFIFFSGNEDQVYTNDYVNFISPDGGSALTRYAGNNTYFLLRDKISAWGQKGKNREQIYSLDALLDDNIPLVCLRGLGGTGKTYLALASALQKVKEEKKYEQIIITRALEPAGGKSLGYLPGDLREKMSPWIASAYDNLEQLLGSRDNIDFLIDDGTIELFSLEYMRGRSLMDKFVIVEEAQNLSKDTVKLLITRMGKNTKMVFCGDIEQIDNKRVSQDSNGLSYLIKRFHLSDEYHKYFAHIDLENGKVRSEIAYIGAKIL